MVVLVRGGGSGGGNGGGRLTSQQHSIVSLGQMYPDNCTFNEPDMDHAFHTCCHIQLQYIYTGPTSPIDDPTWSDRISTGA